MAESSGQRGLGDRLMSSTGLSRSRSIPAQAIIAALSLHKFFGGKTLLNYYSFLGQALSFALPALFFSLLLSMLDKGRRLAVFCALVVATMFHWNGHSEMGIIAAAFIGPITGMIWLRQ